MKNYLEYLTEAAIEKGWLPLAVLVHFDMPEAGEIFNRAAEMYAETKQLDIPVVMQRSEQLIDFFKWLNTYEELEYTEKGISFYVNEYLKSINCA